MTACTRGTSFTADSASLTHRHRLIGDGRRCLCADRRVARQAGVGPEPNSGHVCPLRKDTEPVLVDLASDVASLWPAYAVNETRSRNPALLIAIGIRTYLGYLPPSAFAVGNPTLGTSWPGRFPMPVPRADL